MKSSHWFVFGCVRNLRAGFPGGFPGGSEVKSLPATQEAWVQSLGQEDPLEKAMTTRSSILAWRIPWTEEPGGLQSMVCKEPDTPGQLSSSSSSSGSSYLESVLVRGAHWSVWSIPPGAWLGLWSAAWKGLGGVDGDKVVWSGQAVESSELEEALMNKNGVREDGGERVNARALRERNAR